MGLIAFVLPPAIYLALEAKQGLGRATLAAHGALLALGLLVTVGATGKVLRPSSAPTPTPPRARARTLALALTTRKVLAAKLQAS